MFKLYCLEWFPKPDLLTYIYIYIYIYMFHLVKITVRVFS